MITKEEIKKLQDNKYPLMCLDTHLRLFLEENIKYCERLVPSGQWHAMHCDKMEEGRVYRLSKDYKPNPDLNQWYYSNVSGHLLQPSSYSVLADLQKSQAQGTGWVNCAESFYYVHHIVGNANVSDYELRRVKHGDTYIDSVDNGVVNTKVHDSVRDNNCKLSVEPLMFCKKPSIWWYCNDTHHLRDNAYTDGHSLGVCGKCVDVTKILPYVQNVILSDFNLSEYILKIPQVGEDYIAYLNSLSMIKCIVPASATDTPRFCKKKAEKFYFNNDTLTLTSTWVKQEQEDAVKVGLVEVPEKLLPYIRTALSQKLLVGYKLQKVKVGDTYLPLLGREGDECNNRPVELSFVNPEYISSFWFVKQKQNPSFKEYKVFPHNGKYCFHNKEGTLTELQENLVGFAGIKFKGQKSAHWQFKISRCITKHGNLLGSAMDKDDHSLAVPDIVRILE